MADFCVNLVSGCLVIYDLDIWVRLFSVLFDSQFGSDALPDVYN